MPRRAAGAGREHAPDLLGGAPDGGRPRRLAAPVAYRGPPRGVSRRRPEISGRVRPSKGGRTQIRSRHPASVPDSGTTEHDRQEHRAHEDQRDRTRDHRLDRRRHQGPRPRADGRVREQAAGHRGVADQGEQDRRVPGLGLCRGGQRRAHPRPPPQRGGRAGRAQGCRMGPSRCRRRQLLRAALRGQSRPQAAGRPAQAAGQGRQRGLPRDGRGPGGRGHRLAPGGHAQTARPGAPHGLPRDHPRGDRPRRGQPPRARHRPGRRPGDPPDPRPPVRLRGVPGAVEEGPAEAVGRPGAVRRHPDRRRARAGAHGLPRRRLLVSGGHLRRSSAQDRHGRRRAHDRPGQAGQRRRQPRRHRP